MLGTRFRARSRVKRLVGDILCFLGVHHKGIVGRYYSGDGPEFEVITCSRCGREFGYADESAADQGSY